MHTSTGVFLCWWWCSNAKPYMVATQWTIYFQSVRRIEVRKDYWIIWILSWFSQLFQGNLMSNWLILITLAWVPRSHSFITATCVAMTPGSNEATLGIFCVSVINIVTVSWRRLLCSPRMSVKMEMYVYLTYTEQQKCGILVLGDYNLVICDSRVIYVIYILAEWLFNFRLRSQM